MNNTANTKKTLKIGCTVYEITSETTRENVHGQLQTWIDLRGRRGAEKTLVIHGHVAHLIHLNRMPGSNSERFPVDMISR